MATIQKVRHKKSKVIPTDEPDERPASSLSHNSWVEDLDEHINQSTDGKFGIENDAYQVTEAERLPESALNSDLRGHPGGSVLSVREAVNTDRVDLTDEELDEQPLDRVDSPRSEASWTGRSASPPHGSYAGSTLEAEETGEHGKRRRKRRHDRSSNVVTPVNEDEIPKRSPSKAWSVSSLQDPLAHPEPDQAPSSQTTSRNRSPGVGTHVAGASTSAGSVISVKEAHHDHRIDGVRESGNKTISADNEHDQDNKNLASTSSHVRLKSPELEHEQQAYVPYIYAHDCLAQVMADMTKMKHNHVRIVGQIEDTYRKIEDETQNQFNVFVGGLRIQYKDKVKTFRTVIDIHQDDFQSHKTYWEETLMSLSVRNKALMKEKKKLLIINKMEIDRLEKEKDDLGQELTHKMDVNQSSYSAAHKNWQEERKIADDQTLSEKQSLQDEIDTLRRELEVTRTTQAVGVSRDVGEGPSRDITSASSQRKQHGASGIVAGVAVAGVAAAVAATAVVPGGISEGERRRLEEQRDYMENQWIQSQKDLAILQAGYDSVQVQLSTLAALAMQDKNEQITQQLADTSKDKVVMEEESQQLRQDIEQWQRDFKEQTGREPTVEDRSEAVGEMETQLAEVETKQKELDVRVTTLAALSEGRIPEMYQASVEERSAAAVVSVPDPATVAALQAAQQRTAKLEASLANMETLLKGKDKTISSLKRKGTANRGGGGGQDEEHLKLILGAVVMQSKQDASGGQVTAARLEKVTSEKAQLAAQRDQAQKDLQDLVEQGEQEAEQVEDRRERRRELEASLDDLNAKCLSNEADITALSILTSGRVPQDLKPMKKAQISTTDDRLQELEDRIQELEEENQSLMEKSSAQEETITTLEADKEELERRLEMGLEGRLERGLDGSEAALANLNFDDDDVEGFGAQLAALQHQIDQAQRSHQRETDAHEMTKEELESMSVEMERVREEVRRLEKEMDGKVAAATFAITAELELKDKSLTETKQRLDELEQEKFQNLPVDVAKEITILQNQVKKAESEKENAQKTSIGGTANLDKLKTELKTSNQALSKERESSRMHQENLKKKLAEKDKQARDMIATTEKKYLQREAETKKQTQALEKKIKEIVAGVGAGGVGARAAGSKGGTDAKSEKKIKLLTDQSVTLKKTIQESQDKIRQLEKDVKEAKSGGTADKQASKKMEKQLKELEKKLEMEQKKFEREKKTATELDMELKTMTKDYDVARDEIKQLTVQIAALGVAAAEALELKEKVTEQTAELKQLQSELKTLTDNYNSERVLRKKYYNMVEDMKGKIRVYCRTRPLSSTEKERKNFSIVKAPDEYSIEVQSTRGLKEFQFDHIFMPESTQSDVFEDTNNLIQSSVDGYNVCIFAYGQTGSGKTFTMIGDREQSYPGIAPRAFTKIFEVIEENKAKFSFNVETYMLELYNDKLIDLYAKSHDETAKLDIKKDKKGLVFVNGAVVLQASNAKELYGLFEQGSSNRHVASTKMNAESSRSHLVIGVVIESTNLASGTITRGKLSLVDLAGSERAAKTEASAMQLKEANSINKSLSALGDVISALSSEQSFIPYRNNKLTMLMQDSLGGNSKTLMFVNISPADYNAEETVVSLTYASRVKLITNDASKNADNKEIARLKEVIEHMKQGKTVDEDEVE